MFAVLENIARYLSPFVAEVGQDAIFHLLPAELVLLLDTLLQGGEGIGCYGQAGAVYGQIVVLGATVRGVEALFQRPVAQ